MYNMSVSQKTFHAAKHCEINDVNSNVFFFLLIYPYYIISKYGRNVP